MKKFTKPELEVVKLQADVVCTSTVQGEIETELPPGFFPGK